MAVQQQEARIVNTLFHGFFVLEDGFTKVMHGFFFLGWWLLFFAGWLFLIPLICALLLVHLLLLVVFIWV